MRQPVCYATIFYLFIYLNPAQRFGRQRAVGDVDKHTTHTGEFRTAHHRAMCLERLESWFLITTHIQVSILLKKKGKKCKVQNPETLGIKDEEWLRVGRCCFLCHCCALVEVHARCRTISPSRHFTFVHQCLFVFCFVFLKALSQKRKQVDYQRERLRHNQRMPMHLEGTGWTQLHPCSHVCQ